MMKKRTLRGLCAPMFPALLLGLSLAATWGTSAPKTPSKVYSVKDPLPKAPLPLEMGPEEVRIVTPLRPGLTQVSIRRGNWQKGIGLKATLIARNLTKEESNQMRASLESAGYEVYEKTTEEAPPAEALYTLTAGEFYSMKEARDIAKKMPRPIEATWIHEQPGKEALRPFVMEMVVLDPRIYDGKIISAWSGNNWRTSPLEEAIRHDAVVAANGSFFEYNIDGIVGVPTAISITEGIWHHEHYPEEDQAAILWLENHADENISLWIDRKSLPLPMLELGDGKRIKLDGVDRMPKENEITAMRALMLGNSWYSHGVLSMERPDIKDYLITEKSSGILYNILASGDRRAELAGQDESIGLDLSVPDRPGLSALYTTPSLIENGVVSPYEYRRYGITSRTAIGADAQGRIYLIVALESGEEFDAAGAGLFDLKAIGVHLGMVNLANMDGGGGSTSMVIDGKVQGDNPTRYYRMGRVADSILIIDHKPDSKP